MSDELQQDQDLPTHKKIPTLSGIENEIIIREPYEEDTAFIFSSWLRSYKNQSPITKAIRSHIFFDNYQKILERLLTKSTIEIKMACLKDDTNVILGYGISEGELVHFCYVKESFRDMGIATMIFEQLRLPKRLEGCEYTHLTWDAIDLAKLGKHYAIYNPFKL